MSDNLSMQSIFDLVPLTDKTPEMLSLIERVLKDKRLIIKVLLFIDPKQRLRMNFVSKIFYFHMLVISTPLVIKVPEFVRMLNQGVPREAIEMCNDAESIAKYEMLGPLPYQTIIDKSLDWCPDLSTSEKVEYKANFTDMYGRKCWGMFYKGTGIKQGFVRCVGPGWIEEGHF